MKRLALYDSLQLSTEDEVFDYLMSTFRDSLRSWDYFVNWDKVFRNTDQFREALKLWDNLLGSADFEGDFRRLIEAHPELVTTIPVLIVRDGAHSQQFSIVTDNPDWREGLKHFDFSEPATTDTQVAEALEFVQKTGLEKIFLAGGVSDLADFLLGVEAGLDSNGRKNRGGSAMEFLVEKILAEFTSQGLEYLSQPSLKAIESAWGIELPGIKPGRRFDYAVNNGGRVFVIEVNAYGGGGSKLKATAGEFTGLQEEVRQSPATFVWITEGAGWHTARRPLRDAYSEIDHILNLRLIEQGALEEILLTI